MKLLDTIFEKEGEKQIHCVFEYVEQTLRELVEEKARKAKCL